MKKQDRKGKIVPKIDPIEKQFDAENEYAGILKGAETLKEMARCAEALHRDEAQALWEMALREKYWVRCRIEDPLLWNGVATLRGLQSPIFFNFPENQN